MAARGRHGAGVEVPPVGDEPGGQPGVTERHPDGTGSAMAWASWH